MRIVLCWGGPMDKKTIPVFRQSTFTLLTPEGTTVDRYQLMRVTYRDKPTLTVYEVSVWLADSFNREALDGAPIVQCCKERNLPMTVTKVPADSPIWNPQTHEQESKEHGRESTGETAGTS